MLLEILIALACLCTIVIIFQFCKCQKIEHFSEFSLENIRKQNLLKQTLLESFISEEDILNLEQSTIQMLSGIQKIKTKLMESQLVNEEVAYDTVLADLNKIVEEETDESYKKENYVMANDDGANDDDDDEDDDIVEGFMERTTHNCDLVH